MSKLPERFGVCLLLLAVGWAGLGLPWAPGTGAESAAPAPTADAPADGGVRVARVYFTSRAELDQLAARLDALEYVDQAAGYLEVLLRPGENEALLRQGYRVEIDEARTTLLNQPWPGLASQAGGIPGYPCYRTVEETYASLAALAAANPGLAAWVDIGDSFDKLTEGGAPGYDLNVLVLTNQAVPGPKPAFFLMGAIHAREYATAELAARYAEHLVAGYGVDPDITWLLDRFAVHVLPVANPDGRKLAEAGYYHRKNTDFVGLESDLCLRPEDNDPYYIFDHYGVDLNRNSSFQWGGVGAESYPCFQTYRGEAPASEPETQALQAYLASIFPDQRGPGDADAAPAEASGVLITLHSYANVVIFPWGWTLDEAPNQAGLQTLGRKFGFHNQYGVCQSGACLYGTSGTTDDWAYGERGVAAYTFELGTNFFQDCATFENTILPQNLPALLYAAKASRRPYQAPAGPETLQVSGSGAVLPAGTPLTLTARADDTRFASNGYGEEPVQPIAAARVSLGAPAWVTDTVTFPLVPADGAWDEPVEDLAGSVDTTGWLAGRHLVFVESQDAAGNWGVPGAAWVTIGQAAAWFPFVGQP